MIDTEKFEDLAFYAVGNMVSTGFADGDNPYEYHQFREFAATVSMIVDDDFEYVLAATCEVACGQRKWLDLVDLIGSLNSSTGGV